MTQNLHHAFRLDQLVAANHDHTTALVAYAEEQALEVRGPFHPVVRRFTERLLLWRMSHLIHDCEHLDPNAPGRTYWAPAEPRVLRCADCIVDLAAELRDRRDHSCDYCSRALPVEALEGVRIVAGSTLVLAAICASCAALGSA